MHILKIIAISIGASIFFVGCTAIIIAALWGKSRHCSRKTDAWDESIEDV